MAEYAVGTEHYSYTVHTKVLFQNWNIWCKFVKGYLWNCRPLLFHTYESDFHKTQQKFEMTLGKCVFKNKVTVKNKTIYNICQYRDEKVIA